jgi:ribosomal protein L29
MTINSSPIASPWFTTLMDRTKTMSDEDKHIIEEVLYMQYQIDPLLRESRIIKSIFADDLAEARAEALAEGETRGLQESIVDLVSDCFSARVVSQVQQTITATQNIEQLRKFLRHVARTSDEQEVAALLAQYFPPQQQPVNSRVDTLREAIVDLVNDRFPARVVFRVQHAIGPIQDVELLKKFHRQVARVADEEELSALLDQCFPTH